MNFLSGPLNFDKHTFRCSSLGLLMTEPQGGSNMDKYIEKKNQLDIANSSFIEELSTATTKRDSIKNVETKGWKEANEKIEKIKTKYNTKIKELTAEVKRLEALKDGINLSATCIAHLIDIYVFALSGREQEIYSKYMEKGKKQEGSGIKLLRELDDRFYSKNTERLFNEYINGECDIVFEDDDVIIDTKLSWDFYSFQPKSVQPIDKHYYWQSQGYMELWNINNFVLAYILDDTPDSIIEDEKKRLLYQIGTHMKDSELYADACLSIEKSMRYNDIPLEFRVIKKPIKRNRSEIERCYARIKECRQWLNKYAQEEWDRIKSIREIPIITDAIKIVEEETPEAANVDLSFSEKTEEDIVKEINNVASQNQKKCPQCDSVNLQYNWNDFECNDCGYDSKIDGGKLQANEEHIHDTITMPLASEIAASVPLPIVSEQTLPEVNLNTTIPEPEPISTPVQQSGELNEFVKRINNCLSESDVISLYKEIKHNFDKYPTLKDMLTVKKASFKVVEEQKDQTKKAKEEKTPVEPKTDNKKDVSEASTDVTVEYIKQKTLECKTSSDVKKLYKANREFIDADIELRNFMQEHGEKLDV